MSKKYFEKPAVLSGILWGFFAFTGTIIALLLPLHIVAIYYGWQLKAGFFYRVFGSILFISVLFHGLYRTKTLLFDLGASKFSKSINVVFIFLFLGLSVLTFYSFLFRS